MHMREDPTSSLEQEQETEVTRISSESPEVKPEIDRTQSDTPDVEGANYITVVSAASSIVEEKSFTVEISSETTYFNLLLQYDDVEPSPLDDNRKRIVVSGSVSID